VGNVVFMGMGEPFLNYENVWKAIRFLNDETYFNIGARRISISTIGITEGIRKMAKEDSGVNLAISLHAPNDELRTRLVPSNKKYNISRILEAVDFYIERTNRKVMFEYLLIKDVNSSIGDARELAKLMDKKLYMVNLIPYNPTDKFKPPTSEDIRKFKNILEKNKINVTERQRFGQDIKGACGQLVSSRK
jgi:23S rRNA (adenine2503-C2)-methyltransferase